MIHATASAATPRPTVRNASARRPVVLTLLLMTVLALVGTTAVGQRAAAAEPWRDDIWVSVDGVAFRDGRESDEVAYVVRPTRSRDDGHAFARSLTRNEQNSGWAAFWEARQAYPDGYCVVWVEVEDASSWHESDGETVCTAAEPTATPTPTPPAAPTPTPTPTPSPTPSATPSPTPSSTPTPSTSYTSPEAALVQNIWEQPAVRTQLDAAEEDQLVSPLGWVAVLGGGALLTVGGVLLLWRRLT